MAAWLPRWPSGWSIGRPGAQPAQLWHPILAPLVLGAASARGEADTLGLRRGAEAWLKTKPLVDARTGRAYDRVTYEYTNRAERGYN